MGEDGGGKGGYGYRMYVCMCVCGYILSVHVIPWSALGGFSGRYIGNIHINHEWTDGINTSDKQEKPSIFPLRHSHEICE